jgi:hypothetical protein
MWAKASISPLSKLAREAGEAPPVGNADRRAADPIHDHHQLLACPLYVLL